MLVLTQPAREPCKDFGQSLTKVTFMVCSRERTNHACGPSALHPLGTCTCDKFHSSRIAHPVPKHAPRQMPRGRVASCLSSLRSQGKLGLVHTAQGTPELRGPIDRVLFQVRVLVRPLVGHRGRGLEGLRLLGDALG
jgi:hypothetical protein